MHHQNRPDHARRVARVLAPISLLVLAGCQGRRLDAVHPGPEASYATTVVASPAELEVEVPRLASRDFIIRQRAAERLVDAGERAIPTLGRAGDMMVRDVAGREVSATAPVLQSILDASSDPRVRAQLEAAWPNVRREAATELGRRGGMTAVPALIGRLEDDVAGVRGAAVASLRRLTHRFFGFRASGTLEARDQAGARWREWWAIQVKRGTVEPLDGEG